MFARTVRCRDGFANPCVTLLSVFPKWLTGKKSTCNAGDMGLTLGLGKFPGGGNANPLQYSCLENPWTEEPGGLLSIGLHKVRHD